MLLGKIREKATGWLSYAIVVMLTIPFALWGIHQYFGYGDDPVVAQIGDVEIPLSQFNANYQQRKRDLELSLGPGNLPPENSIKGEVLSQMLQGMLFYMVADEYNYVVPDDVIATVVTNMPEFQREGRFDRELYRELLSSNRRTENAFETGIRNDLRRRQFRNLIINSSFILPSEQKYFRSLMFQEREFRYALLDAKRYYDTEVIGEQEAATYYEGHREDFTEPEKIKLAYVEVSREKMIEEYGEPAEEDLRDHYDRQADLYFQPEVRRVAHIVVSPDTHGREEAEKRADEIYDRLERGEAFAEVAMEMSDDIATSEDGGVLPDVSYGDWADSPDLEDAVFDTPPGRHIEPIEDDFGIRIVKVLEIVQSSGQQTFEDVRELIVEETRRELASEEFNQKLSQLGQLIYEEPYSLKPAATSLALDIVTLDWTERSSSNVLFERYPILERYAFSPLVVQERSNSRLLEVEDGVVFVLRAEDYKPVKQLSFAESKERVVKTMASLSANEQGAALIGEQILPGLEDGTSDMEEMAARHDLELFSPGYRSRLSSEIETPVIDHVFKMAAPDDGGLHFSQLLMKPNTFVVIELSGVREGGDTNFDPPLSIARNEYEALVKSMMREADARLFPEELEDIE